MAPFIQETQHGLAFKIFVQPRSSKNQIVGLHGDALKIKLTAPPVGGAANTLCVKYLAKVLGVPKSSIEIISGHTGRTKRIHLRCADSSSASPEKARLAERIQSLVEK